MVRTFVYYLVVVCIVSTVYVVWRLIGKRNNG